MTNLTNHGLKCEHIYWIDGCAYIYIYIYTIKSISVTNNIASPPPHSMHAHCTLNDRFYHQNETRPVPLQIKLSILVADVYYTRCEENQFLTHPQINEVLKECVQAYFKLHLQIHKTFNQKYAHPKTKEKMKHFENIYAK